MENLIENIQYQIEILEKSLNQSDEKRQQAIKYTIQNLKEIQEQVEVENLPFGNEDGEYEGE